MRYPTRWLRSLRPELEQRVAGLPGVRSARANDLTGSLLVTYDPFALAEARLLETLDDIAGELGARPAGASPAPAVKLDVGRHSLLMLLGTTGVLGLTGLSLPQPVLAGLIVASSLPTLGRAARTMVRRRRLNGDVLEASTVVLLALRGQFVSGATLSWLRSV